MKSGAMNKAQDHAVPDDVAVAVSAADRGDVRITPRNTVLGTMLSLADAAAEETSVIPVRSGKGVVVVVVVGAADGTVTTVGLGLRVEWRVVGSKHLGSVATLRLGCLPPKRQPQHWMKHDDDVCHQKMHDPHE